MAERCYGARESARRYAPGEMGVRRNGRGGTAGGSYVRQEAAGGKYSRQEAVGGSYDRQEVAGGKYGRQEVVGGSYGRQEAGGGSYGRREMSAEKYDRWGRYEEMPQSTACGDHPQKGNPARRKRQQKQRRDRMVKRFCALAVELALCLAIVAAVRNAWKPQNRSESASLWTGVNAGEGDALAGVGTGAVSAGGANLYPDIDLTGYPEDMVKLLELNEEALDYVKGYPDRAQYQNQPINLSQEVQGGQVPLLMQWDRRWGYDAYGDDMIGLSGCGPVCLDMAYLYFTGDTAMTPRDMAAFAYDNGYYADGGTSWSLWTEGAVQLGLSGEELPLDENLMKQTLDGGGLIVCSMRPGDFTTTGHFILIRGYDENGFYVNDPNRRSNSEKQWDYSTLRYQIKNLWALRK